VTDASIGAEIMVNRIKRVDSPCIVCMIFHEANRKRDIDNIESGKKYILDALVKRAILQGDSPKWVIGVPSYTDYREAAGVDVYIIESEDTAALHGMLRAGMDKLIQC
jgi:Holliday junction resolvase RusA-like endonuclease